MLKVKSANYDAIIQLIFYLKYKAKISRVAAESWSKTLKNFFHYFQSCGVCSICIWIIELKMISWLLYLWTSATGQFKKWCI